MIHELKIWPAYFREVIAGTKTWELRKNDRNYQVGDLLRLMEWDQTTNRHTGLEVVRTIIGLHTLDALNVVSVVEDNYVLLSLGAQPDVPITCLADWAHAGPEQINRGNWGLVLAGLLKARQELHKAGHKETWLQGYINVAQSGAELPEEPQ